MSAALGLAFAVALLALSAEARAENKPPPLTIALPTFTSANPADGEIAHDITGIVVDDLRRSDAIAPIDPAAYAGANVDFDALPPFAGWRALQAQALVTGRVARQSDGRLMTAFRLWDVAAGQQLVGQQYFVSPENWRILAHIISDRIYEQLTGKKGNFEAEGRN